MKYLLPIILLICSCSKETPPNIVDYRRTSIIDYTHYCDKSEKVFSQYIEYDKGTVSIVTLNYKIESNIYKYTDKDIRTTSFSIDKFEENMVYFTTDCTIYNMRVAIAELQRVMRKNKESK